MKYNQVNRTSAILKWFFVLPRGRLCIRKRLVKQNAVETKNNDETIDAVHERLGDHYLR